MRLKLDKNVITNCMGLVQCQRLNNLAFIVLIFDLNFLNNHAKQQRMIFCQRIKTYAVYYFMR